MVCIALSKLSGSVARFKRYFKNRFCSTDRGSVDHVMNNEVFTIENIISLVKPIAEKYRVKNIYLFGSYARSEANGDSDLDFLVYGGENFKLTMIFALAEELREALNKKVDVFEIHEINTDSDFYDTIMKERLLVA